MSGSFDQILEVLTRHRVEFVIVGGVAAVLHGAPVSTFDLDALVRVADENADRLAAALTELDARFREHREVLRPTRQDLLAGGHMLLLTKHGPFDVLGFIGRNTRYEDLKRDVVRVPVGGMEIQVLSLDELLRQKRLTNRPKDQPFIRMLEEISRRLPKA